MAPISPAAQRLSGRGLVLGAPGAGPVGHGVLADAAAAADVAERAGLSSLWVVEPDSRSSGVVPYEAFSLLGALAVGTSSIRLGAVADRSQRRSPSVLAKIVTGIDVLSRGRAVLTLDGDGSSPSDAARLTEALLVARAVLDDEVPTVEGRIYSVAGAVNRPAPVQPDGVPLVVFLRGAGPAAEVLEVAARWADAVVVPGDPGSVTGVLAHIEGRQGPRERTGDRVAVLGYVPSALVSPGTVEAVGAAGADGCLLEVAAPWSAAQLDGAGLRW